MVSVYTIYKRKESILVNVSKTKGGVMKTATKKVKSVSEAKNPFSGQLSGQVKKEAFFSTMLQNEKISLPKVGSASEIKLKDEHLTGAFLSILDGAKSLSIDGVPVSKMKVYAGEIPVPVKFNLAFSINRLTDKKFKLSANILSN